MVEFTLPWPPAALSPNRQSHWAVKSKAKREYKEDCYYETFSLGIRGMFKDKNIPISFTFHPPTKRSYDADNLLARMKAGVDGMAAAWGLNDKCFHPITIEFGPIVKNGKVVVRI